MKVVIIIPTYNEVENIGLMIDALHQEFTLIGHEMHVLVVDDHSPDGTAERVREKMVGRPTVHLISGQKKGLGNSYIRGMRHAVDVLGAEVVFEMDADFSHKPEDVPRLLDTLEQGFDFVIGSRYIQGGSIPREWGLVRKWISRVGNIVGRYIAGIYRVRDCTAGFRAIRTTLLSRIDLENLRVQGYAFQIALLNKAVVNGAKIKEIPVEFVDRARGESKLGLHDIMEFIVNAWWIRLQSSATFMKFGVVGASGVVVNLATFSSLLWLGVNKYVASPAAIEVAVIWNFLLNNYWTFRSRKTQDNTRIKGLKFNAVSFFTLAITYTTFILLSHAFPDVMPQVHQMVSIIPGMLSNYFLNSYWTFRQASDSQRSAGE